MALEREITKWVVKSHPDFQQAQVDLGADGCLTFGIEGLVLRGMRVPGGRLGLLTGNSVDNGKFSGEILLHLEIRDPQDEVVGTDSIRLRVAPWLSLTHEDPVERIFIADGSFNQAARDDLPQNLLEEIDTDGTIWLQDHFEMGYTQRPGGPKTHLVFTAPTYTTETWMRNTLLSSGVGIFQIGETGHLRSYGQNRHHWSGDSGGNIETMPPAGSQELGVLMVGDSAAEALQRFFAAQTFQNDSSSFQMAASWLSVGHIDEFTTFLSGRRVGIADPALAFALLENQIPIGDRHKSVFFAAYHPPNGPSPVVSGTLVANTPAYNPSDPNNHDWRKIHIGRNHLLEGDGLSHPVHGRTAYIRIYSGNARGHVAWVKLDDSFVEILNDPFASSPSFTALWDTGSTMDSYELQKSTSPVGQWNRLPSLGDSYVMVNQSLKWDFIRNLSGYSIGPAMPAIITVEELLSPEFNGFREVNETNVQNELNIGIAALDAIGQRSGTSLTYVPMPALFFAKPDGNRIEEATEANPTAGAHAFNPGPTNLLEANGTLYLPKQFAPRTAQGDIYEQNLSQSLANDNPVFVDAWVYHVLLGEIHCGTNVLRTIPSSPWWEKLP